MSSPHKFRVWDGEEMHEPPHDYILTGMRGVWKVNPGPSTTHEVLKCDDNVSALFSTGLTDAEGNEIWEGDIIQSNQSVCLVRWDERHTEFKIDGQFELLGKFSHNLGGYHANSNIKVIGNRYENPELLEAPA
jgi:hypothetical protein